MSSFGSDALYALRDPNNPFDVRPPKHPHLTEAEFWDFLARLGWPDPAPGYEVMDALRKAARPKMVAVPLRTRIGFVNTYKRLAFALRRALAGSGIAKASQLAEYAPLGGETIYRRALGELSQARALADSEGRRAFSDSLITLDDFLHLDEEGVAPTELDGLLDEIAETYRPVLARDAANTRFFRHPTFGVGIATPGEPFMARFRDGEREYVSERAFWTDVLEALFEISPFVGAGPLRFGMTKGELDAAFDEPSEALDGGKRRHFRALGLLVHFGEGGRCDFIEFSGPVAPRLEGRRFLGMRYSEARAFFAERDPALREDATGLVSMRLGASLYCSKVVPGEERVEAVGVFARDYWTGAARP